MRFITFALKFAGCALLLTFPMILSHAGNRAEQFPIRCVKLLPSRFADNMRRDSAWMMSIPVGGLLHSFQTTAGVYAGREGGYMTVRKLGGWESMDCDLRGHITGHLLSALATLQAQTGSAAVKAKADSIVNGLNEVQHALGGSGYLSAFPEGLIDRNIQGKSVWAPFYTLHKIMQGLIDQYTLCHNDTALAIAKRMGLWAYNKLRPLSEDTRRRMIRNEFGGFNEAMYNLFAITRDERYLWVARFFYHNEKVDPLKVGDKSLGTNHANTFIPKLLGEARNYELTDDESSRRAALLLFKTLTEDYAFVTGEVSDKEHLFTPGTQNQHLTGYDGENCCTYNLLKLADHIFSWTADVRVADYYERALYNHILGQQDTLSSMVCYFTPLQTGAYRLYSTRDSSYWCCVGSGFESHAKYASSIYFHSLDALYVNLFIPSQVNWDGTTIRQVTSFPESGSTSFTVTGCERRFTMKLRYPMWATNICVKVNGKRMKVASKSDGYIEISRLWKQYDKVDVTFGMSLHEEPVQSDTGCVALLYGPIVLAGDLGAVRHPFSDPAKYNDYYSYDFNVPTACVSSAIYYGLKDIRHIFGTHFETSSGIRIAPFYDMQHCRYVVYWKTWHGGDENIK